MERNDLVVSLPMRDGNYFFTVICKNLKWLLAYL